LGEELDIDQVLDRFPGRPPGPDHAQIAAVNGVIDYFAAVYHHHFTAADSTPAHKATAVTQLFQQAERVNLAPLLDFLAQRPAVRLIGKTTTENRAPTVAFTVKNRHPGDIAAELAAQKIGIGNGNCYAWRLMQALDIPPERGVVRLSFVHYTGQDELSRLVGVLDNIL